MFSLFFYFFYFSVRNDTTERVALAQELSQFRRDLKPRSRLQKADVHGLRSKLYDLTTKMHDRVSDIRQTTEAKFKLLHEGAQLPPIATSVDEDDLVENGDVVVKLKLCNREDAKEIPKPERKVRRKRTRIPSERLSMASNISIRTMKSPSEGTKTPLDDNPKNVPVQIVLPSISYEQDERLRLTPHVTKTKTEPKQEQEEFRYTTPIPPPREETMSRVSMVSKVTPRKHSVDKSSTEEEATIPEDIPNRMNSATSSKSSASASEDCHDSSGADLDTQHLSNAIQKLRKKMGIHVKVDHSNRDNFRGFQRAAPHKTKRRRKDGHNFVNSKSLTSKSKKRKLTEKTVKLPDVYEKFARRKSTSQVQYMNFLK